MAGHARERRRHVMYVTRHTEYHCRGRECVGVRDRASGKWQRWHGVLRGRLAGALVGPAATEATENIQVQRRLEVGARMVFVGDGTFLTSQLVAARRPPKNVIWSYSSLIKSGRIRA